MLVVSSGSSGSAFLNNHTVSGGAILHYQYVLPEPLGEDMKALGPPPAEGAPAGALDRYAVDAFLKVGIPRVDPSVTVMWLSDLDSTAHAKGIGAPATVEVLRHVDGEIKRIEDGLKAAGLFDSYDIWVTSDHGFSTHTGAIDLDAVLKPFAGTLPDGSPRIVTSGGAIYVRDGDQAAVAAIVAALQKTAGRRGDLHARGAAGIVRREACRARCRSTRRAGITNGPRRFCSRRTGRTRRMRTGCAERSRRAGPPGTAARARGTSTTR